MYGAQAFALLSLMALAWAAPVTYDQRQEGEWNVHAHLDNFVIILIPSSNAANLLDATKLNPFKSQLRHVFKAATQGQQPAETTQPRIADSSVKANGEEFASLFITYQWRSPHLADILLVRGHRPLDSVVGFKLII